MTEARPVTIKLSHAIGKYCALNGQGPNVIYLTDVDYELLKEEWLPSNFNRAARTMYLGRSFQGIEIRLTDIAYSSVAFEARV